ncbi:HAMP domain-containing protein [Candidatus Gracilibacteria bacterium]|nr:HAMP domain-containing protein [Candidatus Gracilibacteria bacterium]
MSKPNTGRSGLNIAVLVLLGAVLALGLFYIESLRIAGLENKSAHFWLEMVGFTTATLAGFAALKQLKITKSSLYLFVALAFFANGFQDIIHGFAAINVFGVPTGDQSVFIPASWTVGRMILSVLFLVGIWSKPEELIAKRIPSVTANYLAPIVMVILSFTTIILLFPIPAFILPDFPAFLRRPYELVAIIPLIIALPLYFKATKKRGMTGTLLMMSLVAGIFVGIIMMNSVKLFDIYFNWSHSLKDVSYILFAMALFTEDPYRENLDKKFRFSIGKKLFFGFGALTLVALTLVITAFAIHKGYSQFEIVRYIGFLAVVTLLFGVLYPMKLVGWLTSTLKNMSSAAEEISKGKTNVEIPGTSEENEIGDLAKSFGRMNSSLKIMMDSDPNPHTKKPKK